MRWLVLVFYFCLFNLSQFPALHHHAQDLTLSADSALHENVPAHSHQDAGHNRKGNSDSDEQCQLCLLGALSQNAPLVQSQVFFSTVFHLERIPLPRAPTFSASAVLLPPSRAPPSFLSA